MTSRYDQTLHGQYPSQVSDRMLNNNYGLDQSNRPNANPRSQISQSEFLRIPNAFDQNGRQSGQQLNQPFTPNKQGPSIFTSPRGNAMFSPISPVMQASVIVNNSKEQAIYEPDEHNQTLHLEEDELISISRGVYSGREGKEKVARAQNKPNIEGAIPQKEVYYQDNTWPKLIENLKKSESPIELELESIFKISQVNILESHCQTLRKKMLDKLDIAITTVKSIAEEEEDVRLTISRKYMDMLNDQYLFTGEQINKSLSSLDKIQKGADILEGQEVSTKEALARVKKQHELCEPSQHLEPALQDFVLENWAVSQLQEMRQFKVDLMQVFTEKAIKDCINDDTVVSLQKLSEKHIFLKPIERFNFLKEIGVREKKPTLEKFGEYINLLIAVDKRLSIVGKQSESAIRSYKDFLEIEIQDSELTITNLQDYKEVLRRSSEETKLLLQYVPEIDKNSKQIDQLIADMKVQIKTPFNVHQKENIDFLEKANKNKSNMLLSLKRLGEYMEERRNLIQEFQKKKELPYILQTPFDWEVSKYAGDVENEKKRLEGLDILIKNIKNIDPISEKAEKINQGIDQWLKQNTDHPASKAELEQKILDLQKDIVTLVDLRDSLGLHHIENSSSEFLHPCFRKEHEHISQIIDKIYDMQDQVMVMNPALIVNPISHQLDQAESLIAASKARTNNKVIFNQDSKHISKSQNPIDQIQKEPGMQFQYEVDLTKEILKGNYFNPN